MTSTSKKKRKKKVHPITLDPDYNPFIVMNEQLQVWTGITNGGRTLLFSDDFDDAKPLDFDVQFRTLKRLTIDKLEQIYI
jgi:hypothetical protein